MVTIMEYRAAGNLCAVDACDIAQMTGGNLQEAIVMLRGCGFQIMRKPCLRREISVVRQVQEGKWFFCGACFIPHLYSLLGVWLPHSVSKLCECGEGILPGMLLRTWDVVIFKRCDREYAGIYDQSDNSVTYVDEKHVVRKGEYYTLSGGIDEPHIVALRRVISDFKELLVLNKSNNKVGSSEDILRLAQETCISVA